MKKAKSYVISILISVGVGLLSALLTRNNMDIYNEVVTPPLSPPAILFPIVWTILYVLMGICASLIYNTVPAVKAQKEKALSVYAISLFLNFIWSIIFFNLRSFLLAFVIIIFLWISILKTITEYFKINRTAAYLQIPYLLWVTFAAYLNIGIWYLNL